MQSQHKSRGPVFWHALWAAVSRPPLWMAVWGLSFLAAIVVAAVWKLWAGDVLDNSYAPGSVLASMSETFRFDHRADLESLRGSSLLIGASLSVVLIVLGAFAAGGWLQVFLERTSGHATRRFLWGGARYFWRFLRVLVLTLLLLVFMNWLVYGWVWNTLLELLFGAKDGNLEVLSSERAAVWVTWFQHGIWAVLFALLLVWGDYTRTRIALHNSRSAIWSGLCSFFLLLMHPVRALRPLLLIFLLEVLVIEVLGRISWSANTSLDASSTWRSVGLLFVLGQLALMWKAISRGARYSAALQVSRHIVPPLSQPDPWGARVGGPGGPQYPIDDTDDYNVSI